MDMQEKAGPEKVQTEEEKTQAQEMAQLKAEVNTLWEEYKAQLDSRGKQQESEASYKQQIDSLFERRDALRKDRVSHTLLSFSTSMQILTIKTFAQCQFCLAPTSYY